jgi:hypothetical protein
MRSRDPAPVVATRSRPLRGAERSDVVAMREKMDGDPADASLGLVQVVLRKMSPGARAVVGRLVRAPRRGSVVVIEFPDGMHEYVTTPVRRVLRIAGSEVFYIETANSRYRLEVRERDVKAIESAI